MYVVLLTLQQVVLQAEVLQHGHVPESCAHHRLDLKVEVRKKTFSNYVKLFQPM
jgi:hypothetical protein